MSDNKEKRIKDGLFGLAPDSFKEIMNREPVRMESEEELFGVPLNMDAGRARISVRRRRISVLAAAAAVIVCVFSWAMFDQLHAVDMLCIDVNPSINVTLNKAGHVRSVKGENQEGEAIVTGAAGELKGVSEPDQVLTVLLEELDADGYFKDQAMDLLLTFVFTDNSRIGVLDSVKEAADNYAKAQGLKETVIAQSIPKDGAAAQAAAQKGLSVGKYHLLKTLEEENHISLQGYEARSIRELNDYVEEKHFVYDGPVVTDSNQVQESASDVGSDTGNSFREESSDQTNDQAKQPAQTDTDDGKKDANDSDKKESADSGQQPGAKKKPLTKESK